MFSANSGINDNSVKTATPGPHPDPHNLIFLYMGAVVMDGTMIIIRNNLGNIVARD